MVGLKREAKNSVTFGCEDVQAVKDVLKASGADVVYDLGVLVEGTGVVMKGSIA